MRHLLLVVAALSAAPAWAHFRFLLPDGGTIDENVVSSLGDPQKVMDLVMGCPSGATATNIVTTVTAGSMYPVRIQETVPHAGHYRVSMSTNRSDFSMPTAVGSNCDSRTPPPIAAPVLLDGQLEHTNAFTAPQTIMVPMPTTPGTYTLQVVEYMRNHLPSCFYWHCAKFNVVAGAGGGSGGAGGGSGGAGGSGGGAATGGGSGGSGGGTTMDAGTAGGAGGSGGSAGGTSGAGGGAAGGTSGTGGGSGGSGAGVDEGGSGCNAAGASAGLSALLALGFLIMRRRKS